MVEIENECTKEKREIERCSWCGESDREAKVYASPGDDIENPKAYHEKCFKALQIFVRICWTNSDEPVEKLVKKANAIVGIKVNRKKK